MLHFYEFVRYVSVPTLASCYISPLRSDKKLEKVNEIGGDWMYIELINISLRGSLKL